MRSPVLTLLSAIFCCVSGLSHPAAAQAPLRNVRLLSKRLVKAPPTALVERLKLSGFYKKYVDCGGVPVLSSEKVSDDALRRAAYLIDQMLEGRNDIRQAIARNRVRFAVMAPDELTTEIPEHSDLTPKAYWDQRARGLGATHARPAVSCGEENLLNLPGDRYDAENILVHEFGHVIHEMGLNSLDPGFPQRLQAAYGAAMKAGLWKGKYAATNPSEYWAEGVQSYFCTNRVNDHDHNHVDTREELAEYDPALFRLIDATFHGSKWRFERYDGRKAAATAATAGVALTIVNRSDQPVTIYWVNGENLVRHRTLAPGEEYRQRTYASHKWRAVSEGVAGTREFVVPATTPVTWTIEPTSRPATP